MSGAEDVRGEQIMPGIPEQMHRLLLQVPTETMPDDDYEYVRRAYHQQGNRTILLEANSVIVGTLFDKADIEAVGADIFSAPAGNVTFVRTPNNPIPEVLKELLDFSDDYTGEHEVSYNVNYYISLFTGDNLDASYALEDGDMITLDGALSALDDDSASAKMIDLLSMLGTSTEHDQPETTGAYRHVQQEIARRNQAILKSLEWSDEVAEVDRALIIRCRLLAEPADRMLLEKAEASDSDEVLAVSMNNGELWSLFYDHFDGISPTRGKTIVLKKIRNDEPMQTDAGLRTLQHETFIRVFQSGKSQVEERLNVLDEHGELIPVDRSEQTKKGSPFELLLAAVLSKSLDINPNDTELAEHFPELDTAGLLAFLSDIELYFKRLEALA